MHSQLRHPTTAGLLGLALGLGLSTLGGAREVRDALSPAIRGAGLELMEPVAALPRTRLALAMEEARGALSRNRPWEAWSAVRDHVESPETASSAAVMLAAHAAAEWGGWREVRALLRGREWLDNVEGAEGWYLLGRAEEEGESWERAADAYRRYVQIRGGNARSVAHARRGRVLRELGRDGEAAVAFGAAAERTPVIADWLRALQAEALADVGDSRVVTIVASSAGGSGPVRLRQARAEADFWLETGDTLRAVRQLVQTERALAAFGAEPQIAALRFARARILLSQGRSAEARELLRVVAGDSAAATSVRVQASRTLGERVSSRSRDEELARASAYEAAGEPGLAARSVRAALAAGGADDPELRLRLGRLLFAARDYAPARVAFEASMSGLTDAERIAEAKLYTARVVFRADRAAGISALRRVVDQHGGSIAAGSALFLLGDIAQDMATGIAYYRLAAETRAPEAREALFRVGDRVQRSGDLAGTIRAWEEYLRRYPRGEESARVAYQVGVLHERAGREGAARSMYAASIAADPLSYHALRAGERAGLDPLERPLRSPTPWIGLPSDARTASIALARLDALRAAGLDDAWRQELDAATRSLSRSPAALLSLAEGLRDQGHATEAIRMGRLLLAARGGAWDGRLLRVVFPFPFRELLEEEAREMRIDPALLAGLVRQESSFNPEARSWVGATGLAQVMPGTGAWLAPAVGIYAFRTHHLTVPEVSLGMGALYLRDQLRRYDGAQDLALAAYNA
ncbi:MAG: transglycosylase SLT domain-containing protein, partial [Gemmatimonadota bacterium]|nr:transglycosylase SLT domain-containing protein [Gemmatimonadota bacterium]